jgi:hypothetical protein
VLSLSHPQVNFEHYIDELRHVYDLYPVTADNIRNGARYPGDPKVQEPSTYLNAIAQVTQDELGRGSHGGCSGGCGVGSGGERGARGK